TLDPAIVQPGRFELVIELGLLWVADVPEILERAGQPLGLTFSRDAVRRVVELVIDHPDAGPPFHCARIAAVCRALARLRARTASLDPVTPAEVERAWEVV